MTETNESRTVSASRRSARRLAIVLGLLAVAVYVGFIALTISRAQH